MFNTVKYFLDETTARKIALYSSHTCKELLELVAPEQLEEKFGGKAKNKEVGDFWPPTLPSMEFGVGQKIDESQVQVVGEKIDNDQQEEIPAD